MRGLRSRFRPPAGSSGLCALMLLGLLMGSGACGGATTTREEVPTAPVPRLRFYSGPDDLRAEVRPAGGLCFQYGGSCHQVAILDPAGVLSADGLTVTLRGDSMWITGHRLQATIQPNGNAIWDGRPVTVDATGRVSCAFPGVDGMRIEGATTERERRLAMFVLLSITLAHREPLLLFGEDSS